MPKQTSIIKTDYKNAKVEPKDVTEGSVTAKQVLDETRFAWAGEKAFDVLMSAIDENLRIQYDNGRIVGTDYATVYTQLVGVAIDKAIQVAIANSELKLKIAETELKEDQLLDEKKLLKLKQEQLRSQIKVYERQAEGFSDNLKLKLLEAQLNAFSMIFSSGMLDFNETSNAFPKALKASNLTEVYDSVWQSAILDWEKPKHKYKVEERISRGGETSEIEL